mmetsp:Transcript_13926/g.35238  ORF Transcript_13926/g.35238 Transcript_13926/m.35238 type:complete len:299 (+) Transcript_13926:173-1069(+)
MWWRRLRRFDGCHALLRLGRRAAFSQEGRFGPGWEAELTLLGGKAQADRGPHASSNPGGIRQSSAPRADVRGSAGQRCGGVQVACRVKDPAIAVSISGEPTQHVAREAAERRGDHAAHRGNGRVHAQAQRVLRADAREGTDADGIAEPHGSALAALVVLDGVAARHERPRHKGRQRGCRGHEEVLVLLHPEGLLVQDDRVAHGAAANRGDGANDGAAKGVQAHRRGGHGPADREDDGPKVVGAAQQRPGGADAGPAREAIPLQPDLRWREIPELGVRRGPFSAGRPLHGAVAAQAAAR